MHKYLPCYTQVPTVVPPTDSRADFQQLFLC